MPRCAHVVDRSAGSKCRHRAAVAIRTEEQFALLGQQQFAGLRIDRRHRALAEQHQLLSRQAKAIMLLAETATCSSCVTGLVIM